MANATLGDITVTFDDSGAGDDTLLLIHGHPFNRSMWRTQLGAASRAGWRAIAPDLRGYGETTVTPGPMPFSTFADDLVALLDHLAIDNVVVAGLSMGGQIAMEFARLYARRVRGLVLAATFAELDTEEGKQRRAATAERLLREGMGAYADEVLSKMLAPQSIKRLPAVAAQVMTMMRSTHPVGAAAALHARSMRAAYEDTLSNLGVPALVVVGSEDAFTTRAQAERMRDLGSKSDLVWLEGIGHMPNLEAPEAFDAALVGFLQKC